MPATPSPALASPARASALTIDGSPGALQDYFEAQGWTDGLPIVPPTPELVAAMVAGSGLAADAPVAPIAPSNGLATVEKVAINAVMAGCRPAYMPVLIAALKAIAQPGFNLAGFQATTHPGAPLIWINGPVRKAIGLNCGSNVFGQGTRANASIGRAVRLVMMNIGLGIPGKTDLATHGNPCKYTYCAGENEEASPWEPFHVEHGYAAGESTVMAFAAEGPHNVNDHGSMTASELLMTLADSMNSIGANTVYLGGEYAVVLSPEHAKVLADDGLSKADVRAELHSRLRVELARVPERNRRRYATIRPAYDVGSQATSIPYVDDPEQILILVAGGPGLHSVVIPGFGISKITMERIAAPAGTA